MFRGTAAARTPAAAVRPTSVHHTHLLASPSHHVSEDGTTDPEPDSPSG